MGLTTAADQSEMTNAIYYSNENNKLSISARNAENKSSGPPSRSFITGLSTRGHFGLPAFNTTPDCFGQPRNLIKVIY